MMNINIVIDKLIHIPRKFNELGTISINSLLKETGYITTYSKITVENIRAMLSSYPECADEWLLYSENKRSISGWYFIRKENEKYIVGLVSNEDGARTYREYNNKLDACAFFIKKEIDDIRTYDL